MVEAAKTFKELESERMKVFKRPVPDEEKELKTEPVFELSLFEIMRAFREIMSEFESQTVSEIIPEQFTIEEKIEIILSKVEDNRQVTFKELFEGSTSKLEIVVTFIAVLELIKRTFIKCKQEGSFNEIWIYRADPEETEEAPIFDSLDEEYGAAARPAGEAKSPVPKGGARPAEPDAPAEEGPSVDTPDENQHGPGGP
jgi:chromatin segregation and condensation protein Rec8/ScpA/Scc1 (kleisin family)